MILKILVIPIPFCNGFQTIEVQVIRKGPSLNYVSIFEGGRGHKMLTDAYLGEGGVFEMLM